MTIYLIQMRTNAMVTLRIGATMDNLQFYMYSIGTIIYFPNTSWSGVFYLIVWNVDRKEKSGAAGIPFHVSTSFT